MNSWNTSITTGRFSVALGLGLLGSLAMLGCANQPGDDVTCPTCNNSTELLVGSKCVPIGEVEPCGPDGHAHGTSCHCFGGQQPTAIHGQSYCLQQGCGQAAQDPEALACDEIARAPEAVTAVTALSEIESAHVDVGTVAEVLLPANQESFAHFEADEAGEFHVHAAVGGVMAGALTSTESPLSAVMEGANEDCAAALPEIWGVAAAAPGPVVLRFQAGTTQSLRLVIYEGQHTH